MSEGEVTYYSDGTIQVTNTRAMLGGKTYAMANITSVMMGEKPANRTPGAVIAIVGFLVTACGVIGTSDSGGSGGWVVGLLFGLLVLGAGIAIAANAKARYVVRVGSASGESDALVSEDKEYIQKIVNAMNEAIIKRG